LAHKINNPVNLRPILGVQLAQAKSHQRLIQATTTTKPFSPKQVGVAHLGKQIKKLNGLGCLCFSGLRTDSLGESE
jgi:hypothetical protein